MLKEETWGCCHQNSMHSFLCLGFLPEIYFCVDRPKLLSFSSKHKLHLLDPPV